MEKKMENEMETGGIWGFKSTGPRRDYPSLSRGSVGLSTRRFDVEIYNDSYQLMNETEGLFP